MRHDDTDYTRIFLAIFLSAVLLIGWQVKVEWPRRQALAKLEMQKEGVKAEEKIQYAEGKAPKETTDTEDNVAMPRAERLSASPRLAIHSATLQGSLALKGARFDDLTLTKYRDSLETDSPNVTLLSPNGDAHAYFAQIGWVAEPSSTLVPDEHALWVADSREITPSKLTQLHWDNGQGLRFLLTIGLDEKYMFSIDQQVENHSGKPVTLRPYAYINRIYEIPKQAPFLHEGPLGVNDGALTEVTYKDLKEKGNKTYDANPSWFGITDRYWLTSFIPSDTHDKVTFAHYNKQGQDRYQLDYLGDKTVIEDGGHSDHSVRFFAGAKELTMLDAYTNGDPANHIAPIPLFDRSLDFGVFYFLAKPMCQIVHYLYVQTGNFGIALLLFIVLIKLLLFPLADKSYRSMAQMRKIQPEMIKVREKYVDDQIGMHKAMRDLYKQQKINPAAGCLPVVIQVIVFVALFRGLNITIEMRHAPFYGWLKDLSAPDPSNLFTGFGLLNWQTPSFLHLALLPILYCISMIIQTSQQPKPADPVQAKVMTYMPYMMLLFFDKMASGFVLYWTWSNILSILQQRFISTRHGKGDTPDAAVPIRAKR